MSSLFFLADVLPLNTISSPQDAKGQVVLMALYLLTILAVGISVGLMMSFGEGLKGSFIRLLGMLTPTQMDREE